MGGARTCRTTRSAARSTRGRLRQLAAWCCTVIARCLRWALAALPLMAACEASGSCAGSEGPSEGAAGAFVGDGKYRGDGGRALELLYQRWPWCEIKNCPGRYTGAPLSCLRCTPLHAMATNPIVWDSCLPPASLPPRPYQPLRPFVQQEEEHPVCVCVCVCVCVHISIYVCVL